MPAQTPLEIAPRELKQRLDSGEKITLIDVREPHEHAVCRIDGSELIPLRTAPQALASLKEKAAAGLVVVYCHHGVRSLQAVTWLRRQGVADCQSLQGGINLWSTAVDPKAPKY